MRSGALVSLFVLCAGCVAPGAPRVESEFDGVRTTMGYGSPAYPIGSLLAAPAGPSAGARRLGCAELQVEAVRAKVSDRSVALAFRIGNDCIRPLRANFGDAHVHATWGDGSVVELELYDPRSQVAAATLDGRAQGTELLEFAAPPSSPAGPARSVCVDVSRVVQDGPPGPAAPICLSWRGAFANVDTIVGHGLPEPQNWRRNRLHWLVEVGLAANYVDLHGATWSGATPSHKSFHLDVSKLGGTSTLVFDTRLMAWIGGPFYLGGMAQFGAGPLAPNAPFVTDDTPVRSYGSIGDLSLGAVAGVSTGGGASPRFRFDVTAGGRAILSELYPAGCGSETCEWDTAVVRAIVKPRVVLDAWLSPWLSVAAWADADALDLPDFGVGLSIAMHPWAYDGLP